jgi:phage shock protein G
MIEILFLFCFAGLLFFTGITVMGILLSVGLSFFFIVVFGMLAVFLKLIPWLLVIVIGIWAVKKFVLN